MGKGITYHVVGLGKRRAGGRRCYPAHSKIEMRQMIQKAENDSDQIEFWFAQTKTGCRILKATTFSEWIPASTLKFLTTIQIIPCPKCGHLLKQNQGCAICRFSGITTKKDLGGYADWQLVPLSENASETV